MFKIDKIEFYKFFYAIKSKRFNVSNSLIKYFYYNLIEFQIKLN
jgi:hypothetical protein